MHATRSDALYEQAISLGARARPGPPPGPGARARRALLSRAWLATSADAHWHEALRLLCRWGPTRSCASSRRNIGASAATPAIAGALQPETLALFNASRAIAGDILLDHLLKTLLRTLMENAGADRGLLFLVRDDELVLAAEGRVESEQVRAVLHSASQAPPSASAAGHAGRGAPRARDMDRCRCGCRRAQVAACLPILRQGELRAVLYLENQQVAQAFTARADRALELLASQAAISLGTCAAHADLKLENWEAESRVARNAEPHVRRLVDSNIIGIFFGTSTAASSDANDAFLQITGYTPPISKEASSIGPR
jgi:hypothetical protein